jgi:hypothetical protein
VEGVLSRQSSWRVSAAAGNMGGHNLCGCMEWV